jgi:ribose transport system ATP-binding protein
MSALEISGLVKRYGSTVALDGADLDIQPGSVHAVIGENGAGKSTLVKILSGLVRPDAGVLRFHGQDLDLRSPRDAAVAGIATAFQELSLLPHLSVADNLALPRKPRGRLGLVANGTARASARRRLEHWEVSDIDVRAPVGSLPLAAKQKVEIVGALSGDPRLVILDEPTSALGQSDVEWLMRQVGRLREAGTTVIFVSHRMPEVRAMCDALTVLRGGRRSGHSTSMTLSDAEIIRMMIGESLAEVFPPRPAPPAERRVALSVRGLRSGRLRSATFDLHHGEILGVAGLQDHGQRELFRAMFGADRIEDGHVELDGERLRLRSPRDAIRAGMGISLVPEERAVEGALLTMSGRANLTLPTINRFTTLGWIRRKDEAKAVQEVLERLRISPRALYEPVEAFSGGNQQKIVIGKWLLAESKVLLLFDPTRGVDIRTKSEIYRLTRAFADEGGCVLYYSTDLDETVHLADRVVVCYRGEVSTPFTADELDSETLLHAMLGGARDGVAA